MQVRPVHPLDALEAARGQLFPFAPVALGTGIGLYFALPAEPSAGLLAGLSALAAALAALWVRSRERRWQPLAMAALLVAAGLLLAALRSHAVAAPVLSFRYYGPIEGRITAIDRSQSDRLRLTLDRVVLARTDPERTPARVRVSLHGDQSRLLPEPGLTVILTGHLQPPAAPAEPGGFDFRRHAWFEGLGAVGYTQTPVLVLAPAEEGRAGLMVGRLRMALAEGLKARIPGEPGGFAAAVLTGDRSGIAEATNRALRDSNLYHLVSISGLHMGLLAGFVFAVIRYGLALVPPLALRLDTRKVAAVAALAASAFYLALAGRDVATERSFIMIAAMLVAVLIDRRAFSVRTVAIGALAVLAMRPETLLNPGFQMSFAATLALVTVFTRLTAQAGRAGVPRWAMPVLAAALSTLVAGTVTAPFAAAHFNRTAAYGLLANLLAAPAMAILVMPGGVIAACLAPLGLAAPAFWMMEAGGRWILAVGAWVAGLEGAAYTTPAPPAVVLPALALGGLWLTLWPGRARWAGAVAVAATFWLWAGAERPALLVAEGGGLAGLLTAEGRALSRPRGEGFAAETWLARDGDPSPPEEAAARPGFSGPEGARRFAAAGREAVHLTGKGAAERLAGECRAGRIVILAAEAGPEPGDCLLIDRRVLALRGALAVGEGLALTGARDAARGRPWGGRAEASHMRTGLPRQ